MMPARAGFASDVSFVSRADALRGCDQPPGTSMSASKRSACHRDADTEDFAHVGQRKRRCHPAQLAAARRHRLEPYLYR
jgi:hypothetical protein